MAYIVIDYDLDPDMSWLEQDHYKPGHPEYSPMYRTEDDMKTGRNPIDAEWYTDPENHVALEMILYDDDGAVLDSLGGIDFLNDSPDWTIGTFEQDNYKNNKHLQRCPYLMELAGDMFAECERIESAKLKAQEQAYLDVL